MFDFLDTLKNLLPTFRGPSRVPHQRRLAQRVSTAVPVQCYTAARNFEATAIDISLQGIRLELERHIAPGSLISLALSAVDSGRTEVTKIHARVAWCRRSRVTRRFEAGISYQDGRNIVERSWIKPLLQQLGLSRSSLIDQRSEIRTRAMFPGQLTYGKQTASGTVMDLSLGGALFESLTEIPAGTVLTLAAGPYGDLGILRCQGQVARQERTQSGRFLLSIRFDQVSDGTEETRRAFLYALLQEVWVPA